MSKTNAETIAAYNEHVQEYIDGTPQTVSGPVKDWIDESIRGLPHDARILELGSAFGRDALYIESQGYEVDKTDVTPGFVKWLEDNGHQARVLNAITDNLGSNLDLVFADAVLLHFTRDETQQVAAKVHESLADGGRFALSLKRGSGEEWSDAKLGASRFFCYWQGSDILKVLNIAGFEDVKIGEYESNGHNDVQWLHIIATK